MLGPVYTSADADPELAALLGQFSQACNYLEGQMEFILTRLLPITSNMGRVLFSRNQLARNVDILSALASLPEVPIDQAVRDRLTGLVPRLKAINDDRSRFLHNRIVGGMTAVAGLEGNEALYLAQHKADGSTAMMPVSKDLIRDKITEAKALWSALYVNRVKYDLTQWGSGWTEYPLKEYPKASSPAAPRQKDQKQNGRRKSEGDKTNRKSGQ
jgi:hypothetical protein